jgi:hypothetical protein
MPGCPGQGLAEEGRARLARVNFDHICTFLGKPPLRPRRAGNLSRSRSFDAAHVLATVTIALLPSAGRERAEHNPELGIMFRCYSRALLGSVHETDSFPTGAASTAWTALFALAVRPWGALHEGPPM